MAKQEMEIDHGSDAFLFTFSKANPWSVLSMESCDALDSSVIAPFFVLSVSSARVPSLDYRTQCSPTQECAPFTFIIAN